MVAKGTFHMDFDRLQTVTKRVCQIDDKEEMDAMLNFYHDLGVVVKHGRTVVLHAQWLIDLFKKLITVRPFDEMVRKCDHSFHNIYTIYNLHLYSADFYVDIFSRA